MHSLNTLMLVAVLVAGLVVVGCGDDEGGANDNQNNQNSQSVCGNGVVDDGEVCDDGDGNSDSLPDACRTDCRRAYCGDGVVDTSEACDSADLQQTSCDDLPPFNHGTLACTDTCVFDATGCFECGNGIVEPDEDCDATDFGGSTCASEGQLPAGDLTCTAQCQIDTTTCHLCGNGTIESVEVCEPGNLAGQDCFTMGQNFGSGTLGCAAGCTSFDTSGCSLCDNGVIDAGEDCDSTDFAGDTCASLGYGSGTIACDVDCLLDISDCNQCDGVYDLINQVGCITGEACSIVSGAIPGCVVPGTVAPFEPCNPGAYDCQAGAICIGDGTSPPTCLPFCELYVPTSCASGSLCLYSLVVGQDEVGLCVQPDVCDPVSSAGCDASIVEGCYIMGPAGETFCFPAGSGPAGTACTDDIECAAGLMCENSACAELCYSTGDCAAGTCQNFGFNSHHPTVGVCQ